MADTDDIKKKEDSNPEKRMERLRAAAFCRG